MSESSSRKKNTAAEEEVEELLKAAQDDVLLKLSLNSHMAHSSSQNSILDPDLDTRFQALKSKSKSKHSATSRIVSENKKNPEKFVGKLEESDDLSARFAAINGEENKSPEKNVNKNEGSDDLLARFTVLKNSIYSSSTSGVVGSDQLLHQQQVKNGDGDASDEEDEVEKVIKWAIDAARLDPSPTSDDDEEEEEKDDDTDDEADAGKKYKSK